jgi:hypothetical protein
MPRQRGRLLSQDEPTLFIRTWVRRREARTTAKQHPIVRSDTKEVQAASSADRSYQADATYYRKKHFCRV